MAEREWSDAEIIESLRQWEDMFYSESETKWLMSQAADRLERKKGKWIHFSRSDECSVCGYDTGKYEAPTWFCPKCGADMRGET